MDDKQKKCGLVIVLITGIVEAIIIVFQWIGLLESEHLLFNFTGSFSNPGLAGGFIACSLSILIYFYTESNKNTIKIFFIVLSILLISSLVLTHSRAGWVAAIFGVCYLFWNSENSNVAWVKSLLNKRLLIKLFLATFFLGAILLIYQDKKTSADGRLFIWEVSKDMVKDKPLIGHGIGMFRNNYPYYQADYFKQNPHSEKAMVAGDAFTPFNEFLSILITQGLLGFFFWMAILFFVFFYKPFTVNTRKQKVFLSTLCIFSFFSYPCYTHRLLILFPLFIGILPSYKLYSNCKRLIKSILIIVITLIVFCFYFGSKSMIEYKRLNLDFQSRSVLTYCQYHNIKYDIVLFQTYYNHIFGKMTRTEEFEIIKDYVGLYPSVNGLCELGRFYKEFNEPNKARECFLFASNINPSLITPHYELFLLYREEGNIKDSNIIGEKILQQQIKMESTVSIKIKAQVKSYLDSIK